jgi:hypothetical protein
MNRPRRALLLFAVVIGCAGERRPASGENADPALAGLETKALPAETARPALRAPLFRLPVLSGPSDGDDRGIVVHLAAVETRKAAAPSDEQKRRSRRRDEAPAGAASAR